MPQDNTEITNEASATLSNGNAKELVVEKQTVGSIDHLAISKSLGYQIFRKSRRNAWTHEEDMHLKKLLIEQFLKIRNLEVYNDEPIDTKEIDWAQIASRMLKKRKGKECKKRWVSSLDPHIKKGKWTAEEDEELVSAYKRHGASWQKVASEIEGRNEDQCSKRYLEVLNCDTKERLRPWTIEEDLILIAKMKEFGTKWRQISQSLPGRPSLTCRNRWRKIVTDVAKNNATDVIKKAVGVLDADGKLIVKFMKSEDMEKGEGASKEPLQPNNASYDPSRNSNADADHNKKEGALKITNSEDNASIAESDRRNISSVQQLLGTSREFSQFTVSNTQKRNINVDINEHQNKKLRTNHSENNSRSNSIANNINTNTDKNFKSNTPEPANMSSYTSSYSRIATPSKTQTDWTFSLVDPRTNEELKSYAGKIDSQDLAHHLIELARYNGVTLTVHQHIHHHYSPAQTEGTLDPQANIQRYGHFNYLPPLTEVPKLTSSSSADNTIESNNSNKNYTESSLLKLLNNEDDGKNRKKNLKSRSPDATGLKERYSTSHRQQLFPSTSQYTMNRAVSNSPASPNNTQIKKIGTPQESAENGTSSNQEPSKNNGHADKKFTNELEEELDFWETMRSMNQPKNNKPVSQHHPLHYYQPSNYKEQLPYQPSDSFGIQRFPNMATPVSSDLISHNNKESPSVPTSITNVNTEGGYGGIYMNGQQMEDEEEEDEIDIANQYGMYYSVFANKGGQGGISNYKQQNGSGDSSNGPTGLVNSGYLMPFNPS